MRDDYFPWIVEVQGPFLVYAPFQRHMLAAFKESEHAVAFQTLMLAKYAEKLTRAMSTIIVRHVYQ